MYTPYPPPKVLEPYVGFFFTIKWERKKNEPAIKELALPMAVGISGFQSIGRIMIEMGGKVFNPPKFYTVGPKNKVYHFHSNDATVEITGVIYTPTGLWHLFKPNITALVIGDINTEILFKDSLKDFKKRFSMIKEPIDRVKAIEELLITQVKKAQPKPNIIDTAAKLIHKYKGCVKIKDLANKLHISERYLQKKFKLTSGITPSIYARYTRFNYLFAEMNSKVKPDYKTLSALFNYYDFAHFSKDFKRYCGQSPTQFHIEKFHFLQDAWINNPFISVQA
jgi:AraC-like DNA-binding protein